MNAPKLSVTIMNVGGFLAVVRVMGCMALLSSFTNVNAGKIPGFETEFPDLEAYLIYVPHSASTNKLRTGTTIPFGNFVAGATEKSAMRYQQVYDASLFAELPPEGAFVDSFFLRSGCGGNNGAHLESNTVVRLSHTDRTADNLSLNFSQNLGKDALRVAFQSGYIIEGDGARVCDRPGPEADHRTFDLRVSFLYQPSKGGLLLDLTIPEHPPSGSLLPANRLLVESVDELGDGTSSVYASPSTATVADAASTTGLMTVIQLFPFPKLHIYQEGTNVLIYYQKRPRGVTLQTRRLELTSEWADFSAVRPRFGEAFDFLATLYIIPKTLIQQPTLFRLFWDSPQIGITNPPPSAPLEAPLSQFNP